METFQEIKKKARVVWSFSIEKSWLCTWTIVTYIFFQQEKVYEDNELVQSFGISPPIMSSTTALPEGGGAKSDQPVVGVQRPKLSLKPRSQPVYVMPASGSVKERYVKCKNLIFVCLNISKTVCQ